MQYYAYNIPYILTIVVFPDTISDRAVPFTHTYVLHAQSLYVRNIEVHQAPDSAAYYVIYHV